MILAPAAPPDSRTRVLCVDDNPDIADTEAMLLGLHGFDARPCYGGREALAAVESFEPQICLLDFNMPEMDGDELAAGLRSWAGRRPLCLIAVTGARHLPYLIQGAVFDLYLFKPVAPDRLLAAVAARAGRRIAHEPQAITAAAADDPFPVPSPSERNLR